jgi:hypothetical protein
LLVEPLFGQPDRVEFKLQPLSINREVGPGLVACSPTHVIGQEFVLNALGILGRLNLVANVLAACGFKKMSWGSH